LVWSSATYGKHKKSERGTPLDSRTEKEPEIGHALERQRLEKH